MNDNTTIKNNSATNQGGGVFVNAPATLTMNGGTITENSAKTLGGGVSLFGKGTGFPTCKFTMNASGSPKIYNNIADEAADDVNGNGYNTEINLISVADMSLPSTVNAINWYYDIDSARYRDLSATKSVFADTLLSNITEASKLTVGITYTVNFDSKGGSNVDDITNIATDSTITKPADPTKDDYAFKGWYTDSSCTTAWDFNNDKVTDNITLYAKWDKVVTKSEESKTPKTGDISNLMLWVILLITASGTVILIYKIKRR